MLIGGIEVDIACYDCTLKRENKNRNTYSLKFEKQENQAVNSQIKKIQDVFRKKKLIDKSKQEIKEAVKKLRKPLLNRICYFGKYKLFLQCYKQINPEAYVVQIDTINYKDIQLPRISDSKSVEKSLMDKIIESNDPIKENIILINEESRKIYFQEEQKKDSKKSPSNQVEKNVDDYEEEYYDEDIVSQDSGDKSGKKAEKNQNYSFDSVSEGDQDNANEKLKANKQEQTESKPNQIKDYIQYNEEQLLAAIVIQNSVQSKKEKEKKKKDKVILVQVFVSKFNQKFIFQLYRSVQEDKSKDQVSFENLLQKPKRWFAKLDIPTSLSQEIIQKNKQKQFNPLDYFDLLFEVQQIKFCELPQQNNGNQQLNSITKEFNLNRNNIKITINIIYSQVSNTLIFHPQDSSLNIQDLKIKFSDKKNLNELNEIGQQIVKRLIIKDNKLQEISQEEEKATLTLQKQYRQEILHKKQGFYLRLNDENGGAQLVQGECFIFKKMDSYILDLLKYKTINDPTSQLIPQQRIQLGKLTKEKRNQLLWNFETLIKTSINIKQGQLVFDDLQQFTNPQVIQTQIISRQ